MFRCLVHPEFSAFRWRRRSFCGYFAVKQLAFFTLSKFIEPRTAQPTASLAAGHRAKPARKKTSSKQPVIPTAVGSRILPVKPLIPASPKARQRHGLGERARPRVHQHAPPRAELKNMRPQAGGIFDMSGARRPRRQARSPGPFNSSSVSFPRHRHGSAAPSSPFDSIAPTRPTQRPLKIRNLKDLGIRPPSRLPSKKRGRGKGQKRMGVLPVLTCIFTLNPKTAF